MRGDRLRKLRESKKMYQEDLAKIINVSKSSVGMYERNEREPNDETFIKIAEFFDCTTDYLLGKSDEPRLTEKEYHTALEEYHELIGILESLPEEKRERYIQRIRDFARGLTDAD